MTPSIVVGYDGTDHGDDALALGRRLAQWAGAKLIVVCAYPHDPLGPSAAGREVAEEMRLEAERTLARAHARLAGEDAELRAVGGSSPSQILRELAASEGAEMIVVGASHHGKAVRLLTGSTPQAVLDGAPCPVAVAPDGYRARAATAGAPGDAGTPDGADGTTAGERAATPDAPGDAATRGGAA